MRSLTGNILLNMRDAVVTVDGDDRITIFSRQAEELFHSTADEVTGKKLDELSAGLPGVFPRCLQPGVPRSNLNVSPVHGARSPFPCPVQRNPTGWLKVAPLS